MKCPKCGFVSFPGHEECKKCGHRFIQVNGEAEGIPPLFHHAASESKPASQQESESKLDQTELGGQDVRDTREAMQTVRCPECDSFNIPGVEQCSSCGHPLTRTNGHSAGIPVEFDQTLSETESPSMQEADRTLDPVELGEPESGGLDIEMEPQVTSSPPPPPRKEQPPPQPSHHPGLSPWQAELAERVQEYRQRRARLQNDEEGSRKTLKFDFGSSAAKPEEPRPHVIEFPSADESASRPKPKPEVRAAPPSFGMGSFESAFREEEHEAPSPPPPPQPKSEPPAETGPLEIELGPSGDSGEPGSADDTSAVPIARMSMRFYAGLMDAVVLLSGAAIYALIFWQVGGSFSRQPLNLGVTAVAAAFFILLYVTGCTAIASATPGLIWAGLEVITFEGNPPRLSDSLWRGFGYLVSMSALMLGFIWAAVDAEGLTWHDRMSRTFIVPTDYR